MKLLAVTPLCVSDEELHRRQDRYDRLAPAGVDVQLLNLGSGTHIPRALNTKDEIEASEIALLERFRQAQKSALYGAVDGFLPDCVLDPVVDRAETGLSIPVFGLLKLTSHFLGGLGDTVGAVARNEAIAHELDRKYASYGHGPLHEKTSILGLSVDDIADDELWARVVDEHLETLKSKFVINGCSAVEVHERGEGSVIVDPTAAALSILGLAAATGLFK